MTVCRLLPASLSCGMSLLPSSLPDDCSCRMCGATQPLEPRLLPCLHPVCGECVRAAGCEGSVDCEACSVPSHTHSLPLDPVRQDKMQAEGSEDARLAPDKDADNRKADDLRLQVLESAMQRKEELPDEVN